MRSLEGGSSNARSMPCPQVGDGARRRHSASASVGSCLASERVCGLDSTATAIREQSRAEMMKKRVSCLHLWKQGLDV